MCFAYLNDKDVKQLMRHNQICTPFFLIEASENTKVDYYVPTEKLEQWEQFWNGVEAFQLLIQSDNKLNLYIASEQSNN